MPSLPNNFFNRKKNDNDATASEQQTPAKKGRDEYLSAVLNVTTEQSVLEIVQENKRFITKNSDGDTAYVLLAVDTNKIGGLSKKQARDADKGAFLSQLSGHGMDYYATEETMEEDMFFLIPNEKTISTAMEYNFMRHAMLYIAFFTDDGDVEVLDSVGVTLDQIQNMIDKKISIDAFLQNNNILDADMKEVKNASVDPEPEDEQDGNEDESDEDEDDVPDGGGYEEAYEDVHDDDDEDEDDGPPEGFIDDESYGQGESDGYDNESEFFQNNEGYEEESEESDEAEYEQDYDDEEDEDDESIQYGEVTEEDTRSTLVRRFYTNDLDLEVTTKPFDAQFMKNNIVPQFDEDRSVEGETGWLSTYLNELSKSANSDLRRIHNDNIYRMREKYIRLLSEYCESLQRDLDLKNPPSDTKYSFAAKYNALREGRKKELDNLDEVIASEKSRITTNWNERLERVGKEAATIAQRQYRERYERAYMDELSSVETIQQKKIEDEYQDALRLLNISRRETAKTSLEAATTSIISAISSEYADCIAAEKRAYNKHRRIIDKFIEDNRKNDIAVAEAKSSEVAHKAQMDELVSQHKMEIARVTADCDAKCAGIRQDAENMRAVMHSEMDRNTRDCEYRVQQMSEENEKLRGDLDKAMQNYTVIEQKKQQEYQSLINEMKNEKQAWVEKCDHIVQMNKRSNMISILVFVVAIVAALAAGLVIGSAISGNKNDDSSNESSVVSQVSSSESAESSVNSETTDSSADSSVEESDKSEEESSNKSSSKSESSKQQSSDAFGNVSISTN